MNTHLWLSKLVTGLISIFQAASLRDRVYTALDRVELLETALADIERINSSSADSSQQHRLIAAICHRVGPTDAER